MQHQDILSVLQVVVEKDLFDPPKYILSCLYNNQALHYAKKRNWFRQKVIARFFVFSISHISRITCHISSLVERK